MPFKTQSEKAADAIAGSEDRFYTPPPRWGGV